MIELGAPVEKAVRQFHRLGLEVVPFGEADALASAELRTSTRHAGLSLADRACLALAIRENAPVITADRAWARLDLGLDIQLIR